MRGDKQWNKQEISSRQDSGGGITNEKTITEQNKYAMDAYQLNPSEEGTMAYDIKQLQDTLKDIMKWKFVGKFKLETNVVKEIPIPETASEVWVMVGQENVVQIYGGVSATIPSNQREQNIVFFEDIYGGYGQLIAKKAFIQYMGNILSVKFAEFVATDNKSIAARVYYR